MQDFARSAAYLLAAIVFGWLLHEGFLSLQTMSSSPWIAIAALHTLIAALLLMRRVPSAAVAPRSPWLWILGPAGLILGGSILLGLLFGPRTLPSFEVKAEDLWLGAATVLWVPLVEELVYRRGLGRWLQARCGTWYGIYLASLIFALAHGVSFAGFLPTPPLGPFLLALSCELIYRRSGSLWGAIAFHGACNASALIFFWLDPRWLEWLRWLYLEL